MRLNDSALWIFGSAMFTMVASSTTMSWASRMIARAADLRLRPAGSTAWDGSEWTGERAVELACEFCGIPGLLSG